MTKASRHISISLHWHEGSVTSAVFLLFNFMHNVHCSANKQVHLSTVYPKHREQNSKNAADMINCQALRSSVLPSQMFIRVAMVFLFVAREESEEMKKSENITCLIKY